MGIQYDYTKSSNIRDALYEYYEVVRLCRVLPSEVVIDVGCGMNWLKELGFNVIGIDIAENSRADVIADATRLPLRSKSVDIAISVEMIEHLPKERGMEVLRELARVARRCIAVSTVNRYTGKHDLRHVHEYSFFELFKMMKRVARVVAWGFGGYKLKLPKKLQYLLPFWLWCEWFAIACEPK